ncbi:MAG: nuclear transport factor 2 family protein [Anaerolineales bacterium]|jgi:ketosteroid isomerase-like protein|nr:nuclear transport factor 2 family protein [Anaerolineales bacterium]
MAPARMAKIESAVRIVLAFTQACNRHDLDGMLQLISQDCVIEDPEGRVYTGKPAIAQLWQGLLREAPEIQIEIEEIFGMGLRCILRWKYEQTDSGGQKKQMRGVDIFQIRDGFICEKLSYRKKLPK